MAEVVSLTALGVVPAGSFNNCLQTPETTPQETDLLEQKYYATSVGNVFSVNSRHGDQLKLVTITTNSE